MKSKIRNRRESVLRSLYSSQSGLIMHSSAVEDVGNVFVFAGVADVGKSTVANKLSKKMTVINDDMNILEFTEKGIEVSTYFTQAENRGYHYLINEDAKGILKAVFFPKMEFDKKSYIEKIDDRAQIWRTLLTCVAPPLKGEDELFPNYLAMMDKLTDTVPFFNIHHNLNDRPEFIAELLRGIE